MDLKCQPDHGVTTRIVRSTDGGRICSSPQLLDGPWGDRGGVPYGKIIRFSLSGQLLMPVYGYTSGKQMSAYPIYIQASEDDGKSWSVTGEIRQFEDDPPRELGRNSDFVYDHPDCQCGPEDDPRAELVRPERFSMLHQELREERLAVSEELLSRYGTGGIIFDMLEAVPYCRFDEVDELNPLMTEWMRSLKGCCSESRGSSRKERASAR